MPGLGEGSVDGSHYYFYMSFFFITQCPKNGNLFLLAQHRVWYTGWEPTSSTLTDATSLGQGWTAGHLWIAFPPGRPFLALGSWSSFEKLRGHHFVLCGGACDLKGSRRRLLPRPFLFCSFFPSLSGPIKEGVARGDPGACPVPVC